MGGFDENQTKQTLMLLIETVAARQEFAKLIETSEIFPNQLGDFISMKNS